MTTRITAGSACAPGRFCRGRGDSRVRLRALDHLEEWLIATLIAAATALIFVAVLHRYGTGASIDIAKWVAAHGMPFAARAAHARFIPGSPRMDVSWAQELCIYMFIWMAKFGAAYGVRTGIHVGVDVLVNMLPAAFAQAGDPVRPAVRRVFHRRRSRRSAAHSSTRCSDRPAIERSRSADVDRLPGDPARLRPDVLPLPAGRWWFYWTGELPHHDEAHVEGIEQIDAAASGRTAPHGRSTEPRSSPLGTDPDPGADSDLSRSALRRRPASSCCRRRVRAVRCSSC